MIIKVQKVTTSKQEAGEEILARFCYLYPAYTYAQARKLPYKRIQKMIKEARKEKAYEWYNLLKIAVAPQKKGMANKLIKEYKDIINS